MGLMAHCNTTYVDEAEVRAVEAPEWTDTWHPVAHGMVLDAAAEAVSSIGLNVVKAEYSLSKTGGRMFGFWELDHRTNGSNWSIGLRNSIDKSMVLGVSGGLKVFVCDNMALSGDYIEFHKHTAGLDQERVARMFVAAMAQLIDQLDAFTKWHGALKHMPLTPEEFARMTYEGMKAGAFAPRQFNGFHNAYDEEVLLCEKDQDAASGQTVYSWHGAVTRLMRGESMFSVAKKNTAANNVIKDHINRQGYQLIPWLERPK